MWKKTYVDFYQCGKKFVWFVTNVEKNKCVLLPVWKKINVDCYQCGTKFVWIVTITLVTFHIGYIPHFFLELLVRGPVMLPVIPNASYTFHLI